MLRNKVTQTLNMPLLCCFINPYFSRQQWKNNQQLQYNVYHHFYPQGHELLLPCQWFKAPGGHPGSPKGSQPHSCLWECSTRGEETSPSFGIRRKRTSHNTITSVGLRRKGLLLFFWFFSQATNLSVLLFAT